jgi:FecR protein
MHVNSLQTVLRTILQTGLQTVVQTVLATALILGGVSTAFAADDGVWSVSKSSGEVWVTTTGTAQVALTQEETLRPGDMIRTGHNGRVLLVRGEETILIAPNSVIGLPTEKSDGLATTILQQAGSILLEVEKKNVKHFEVETPYLAAVVKGTQFSVTVNANSTSVSVTRGQVEVSDFKSGQIAQVMPGQVATTFPHGKSGLSLSGSGTFNPIEQGKPRASSIDRIQVPKGGLTAPQKAGDGKTVHALGGVGILAGKLATAPLPQGQSAADALVKRDVIRIASALGEVQLNVQKATHGLAHASGASGKLRNMASNDSSSVWSGGAAASQGSTSSGGGGSSSNASGSGLSSSSSNASGSSLSSSSSTSTSTASAAIAGAASVAGSGYSATVNGGGYSATGNGNGNGGVGNGNGKGNLKH